MDSTEARHYCFCSLLYAQPWNSAWQTLGLNTHLLHEGRSPLVWVSPAATSRGGIRQPSSLGLRLVPSACGQDSFSQESFINRFTAKQCKGRFPKTSMGRSLGPKPGCDQKKERRERAGWEAGLGLFLRTCSQKRPHSCSAESEARGWERRQDPRALTAATLSRPGRGPHTSLPHTDR